jgi:23S rRNA (uracil1939-C5)-methyltransferase
VVGVEGSASLVRRAEAIAAANGLAGRATFRVANLFDATAESIEALGPLDRMLIDPPREGAIAAAKGLPPTGGPRRIVYVSCNPATLARDAAVLTAERGYTLAAAGVVNMFPHTAHVESIAVFER